MLLMQHLAGNRHKGGEMEGAACSLADLDKSVSDQHPHGPDVNMKTTIKHDKELCDRDRLSVVFFILLSLYPWKRAMSNTEAVQQYLHGIQKKNKL